MKRESLPTGSAWTLFFNSIGIMIYSDQFNQWKKRIEDCLKRKLTAEEITELTRAVSGCLGLSMKTEPNPSVMGIFSNGSEFLKGIFVAQEDPAYPRYIWTPLPSRVGKMYKKIVRKIGPFSLEDLKAHVKGVAQGYTSFLLGPLHREAVNIAVRWKTRASEPEWSWSNVVQSDENPLLPLRGSQEFYGQCLIVYSHRYGVTIEEIQEAVQQLYDLQDKPALVGAPLWWKIMGRDYLGYQEGQV